VTHRTPLHVQQARAIAAQDQQQRPSVSFYMHNVVRIYGI